MGQIANQMAFEIFYKVKEKIKETRAEKKNGMSIEEQFNLIADEYDANRKGLYLVLMIIILLQQK